MMKNLFMITLIFVVTLNATTLTKLLFSIHVLISEGGNKFHFLDEVIFIAE